jgi:3-deoxy-D-manno-octulosonate 8-phosphate phosphatase (KDO 8-P phosphatase)
MLTGLSITDEVWSRAKDIRLLGIDVDGVLTDGTLYYSDHGELMKAFHTLDGFRIKLLRQSGIEVAVLSGRDSPMLRRRLSDLGITHIHLALKEKGTSWGIVQRQWGLSVKQCAFIGDDWIDVPALERSGLAVAVPEAPGKVKSMAHYVTSRAGGKGAVAELAELLLQSQGKLEALWEASRRSEGVGQ